MRRKNSSVSLLFRIFLHIFFFALRDLFVACVKFQKFHPKILIKIAQFGKNIPPLQKPIQKYHISVIDMNSFQFCIFFFVLRRHHTHLKHSTRNLLRHNLTRILVSINLMLCEHRARAEDGTYSKKKNTNLVRN